jgi:hypothetical protein
VPNEIQQSSGSPTGKRVAQIVGGVRTGLVAGSNGKTEWTRDERVALVARVQGGDKTAVAELRAMFVAHPDVAQRSWDPTRSLRHAMAARTCAPDDLYFPELYVAQAEAMQRELEGEHPTALERLLCERVVTAQLIVQDLETTAPSATASPTADAALHDEMVTRAHDRLLRAVLALAKVRRLLRPEVAQVNIAEAGAQQVNMAALASHRDRPGAPPAIEPAVESTPPPPTRARRIRKSA